MKIISKYKDYYDYLVGIYGIDEIMVFDRRKLTLEKPSISDDLEAHTVAFCGQIYTLYQYNKKFYHTLEEITKLNRILKKKNLSLSPRRYLAEKKYMKKFWEETNQKTNVNIALRQPVLIQSVFGKLNYEMINPKSRLFRDSKEKDITKWNSCILSDFNFHKCVPPEEAFQKISAFIAYLKDHPEIPNRQSDDEKLNSHGFDKKISFRHRK